MTVDNRDGLATLSREINPTTMAMLDAFPIGGRALQLGAGDRRYGEAIGLFGSRCIADWPCAARRVG